VGVLAGFIYVKVSLFKCSSTTPNDEVNGSTEFMQPYIVFAGDALLAIDTAVISAVLSLDDHLSQADSSCVPKRYNRRKITESLGNVTVRGVKRNGKSKGGERWPTVCLSVYSITENIYYSQMSSIAILLQPESVSHRIIQGKGLCCLSLCAIVLRSPPPSHVSTSNGQRSSQLF
jgi:hypothetical protein